MALIAKVIAGKIQSYLPCARPQFHLSVPSSIIQCHLDVVEVSLCWQGSVMWRQAVMMFISLAHLCSHIIFSKAIGAMSKSGICCAREICSFSNYRFQGFLNKRNALNLFIASAPVHLKDIAKPGRYEDFMKRYFKNIYILQEYNFVVGKKRVCFCPLTR